MFSVIPHVPVRWHLGAVLQGVDEVEEECVGLPGRENKDAKVKANSPEVS